MSSEIKAAIKLICDEKGISYDSVMETIKAALAAAYRKDFGNKMQNIQVEFDPESGKLEVFDVKTVVEDVPEELLAQVEDETATTEPEPPKEEKKKKGKKKAADEAVTEPVPVTPVASVEGVATNAEDPDKKHFNPKTEIQIKDAKAIKKSYKVGDVITTQLEVGGEFGRMAAQTAKQVIIQKLREAERETVYNEFKGKEGMILIGTIQRREGRMVLVDLGKGVGLMPPEEQIGRENYIPGEHCKVFIVSVNKTTRGPEIIVSRARPEIVAKFFEMEIPEIASGVVEIKGIAREAGSRTKIAVWTGRDNIDPIGSCIGQRGARVQTIISELQGEKIDIILFSDDVEQYITHALSPAKISHIKLDQESKTAVVTVAEDQLSLAIGKAGQNVRLAARLTGWKIDITSGAESVAAASEGAEGSPAEAPVESATEVSEPAETAAEPAPIEEPAAEPAAEVKPKAKKKKKK